MRNAGPHACFIRSKGFTLLELLVAMAIFAVLGTMAVGGLNAVVDQQALARDDMEFLQNLQRTVRVLTDDLYQLHPREVRDMLGQQREAPLIADGTGDYLVRLSREGWRNPIGTIPRSTVQRVQYRIEDDKLIREHWPVLDPVLGTEVVERVLLEDVEAVTIEYLDDQNEWQSAWPPLSATQVPVPVSPLTLPGTAPPPRGIRFRIDIRGFGEIERLIEVPG